MKQTHPNYSQQVSEAWKTIDYTALQGVNLQTFSHWLHTPRVPPCLPRQTASAATGHCPQSTENQRHFTRPLSSPSTASPTPLGHKTSLYNSRKDPQMVYLLTPPELFSKRSVNISPSFSSPGARQRSAPSKRDAADFLRSPRP